MQPIPLIRPYITDEVKAKVCEVLDSGYLTEGPVTAQFEAAVKHYVGCAHALAVTSCTTGLELALRVLAIGPGDEVVLPDYTYPATADAVAVVGATPVIVDVSRDTMLIDYDRVEAAVTPRTKALLPVSGFGNPLDYDRLDDIKARFGVYVVEDAACAIGAEFKGRRVGGLADISVFSFHPRKFITTGEGGMVTTNNPDWAEWMVSYKHFGMTADPSRRLTRFGRIGSNYKMSNLLAAVGLVQMGHIDALLAERLRLSQGYIDLLAPYSDIVLPRTTTGGKHSRQSFCVYIRRRDAIIARLRSMGIEVQIGTYALHREPAFGPGSGCRLVGPFDGSRYAFDHCLTLPLYHGLTEADQRRVIEALAAACREEGPQ